ncbi:MAG: TonB-dependent receptor [Bryobacterales bacterium]|nr:TonB-dependent receptor [Bryobacterales bacterium]
MAPFPSRFHLFLLLIAAPAALMAQENRGAVIGRVTDSAGAVVAGAEVQVRNLDTGVEHKAVSNEAGNYLAPSLPAGRYSVEAEKAGFKRVRIPEVQVQIQQSARVDINFEIGDVQQSITVTANAPIVITEDATLGQVVESHTITELPLSGRNITQLALLGAGMTTSTNNINNTVSGVFTGGVAVSANGMRPSTNQYSVDGANINLGLYNYPGFVPVVDAVSEFKVRTGNYSAEFGGFGGAHIDYSLRSGTNQFHGALWEFFRNDKLDARNAFATTQKPVLRQNQFGGVGAGPIIRNRTFFMVSYQGFRQRQARILQGNVPLDAWREGDFRLDGAGRPIPAFLDPSTRLPFPGNRIPVSRFSPTMRKVLDFYPLPNQAGAINYRIVSPLPSDSENVIAKFDHVFSDRNRFSARYVYQQQHDLPNPATIRDFSRLRNTRAQNAAISDTHTFTPTTFLDARISWNRLFLLQATPRNSSDNQYDARRELNMIIPSSAKPGSPENGIPYFAVTGLTPVGDQPEGSPLIQPDENYQGAVSLTALRGRHMLKTGVDFLRTRSARFRTSNTAGRISFAPGNTGGTGQAMPDFFLGLPQTTTISTNPISVDLLETRVHGFVMDNWSVAPKLTLNLGVRYELNYPLTEPYGRIPIFDFTPPGSFRTLAPGAPLVAFDKNNFAPRFGFAWRPVNRTVVRGGYGIFYSEPKVLGMDELAINPPLVVSQVFFSSLSSPLRVEDAFPLNNLQAGGAVSPNAYQQDRRTGYVQTWSLSVQRGIGKSMVFEIGYVGNHALKMLRQMQLNIPSPGPGAIQARRPLPQFGPVTRYIQADSTSNYNGLQTRFERSFSSGLSVLATYTYSSSLDLSGDEQSGGTIDPANLNRDRSLSDVHVRHRFSTAYVFQLPFGPGRPWLTSGVMSQVARGWQLSGTTVFESGRPMTITAPGDRANVGLATRPNRTCDGSLAGAGDRDRWFDTDCFELPALYTFGNAGRNIVIGPGTQQWNLGIARNFQLFERHALQFRGELFNAFNHVNLNNPSTNMGTPSFGRILSAREARTVQLGLKYIF